MEFHQNDDAPVSLMEMRFFIPASELAGDTDPVEAFQQQVMSKASVISISGDAIAIFRDIACLTPRGRYDIKIFQSFFQLHGKTFDYKIPMSTVLRLFILPHRDSRQMFFVVSLDPPIKQGQTRYHFLVFLFKQEDEETTIELPFTDEELKEKYEGKLEKELSGPTYEVLGKVMKHIAGRKLTGPGAFMGHTGTPAVSCSFKAAAGFLYPLERGFIYVHKPPIHIRFEEIASVNFARGGGSTRSFDFEVELKSGTVHTFSSIEKEEYGKLFDFITSKKLNIKNRGKSDKASYKDDFGNSDEEAAPDAYLERVKAEGQERDDDDDDDDESTDEDFDPDQVKKRDSDVAEEFDSNPSTSDSEDEEEGSDGEKKEKKKKKKSAKTVSEKPRKRKEKSRDDGKPKRASTAFMIWLNATRESIKKDNPGIKVTEIAKKGGEMWREMKDKSEWEKKAAKEKEAYNEAMKEYTASGGKEGDSKKKSSSSKKPSSKPTKSDSSPNKSDTFKSKEFIETDSSSDEDEKKKNKKDTKKATKKDESGDESDKDTKSSKRKQESDDEKEKKKSKKKSESSDDEKKKKSESKGKEKDNKAKPKSKKDESEEELEDEEEILSSPTASEASGSEEDSD